MSHILSSGWSASLTASESFKTRDEFRSRNHHRSTDWLAANARHSTNVNKFARQCLTPSLTSQNITMPHTTSYFSKHHNASHHVILFKTLQCLESISSITYSKHLLNASHYGILSNYINNAIRSSCLITGTSIIIYNQ